MQQAAELVVYLSEQLSYLVVLWSLTFMIAFDALVHHHVNPYLVASAGVGHGAKALLGRGGGQTEGDSESGDRDGPDAPEARSG
jgi:hypothetical protein